jgi:hypothetical protein
VKATDYKAPPTSAPTLATGFDANVPQRGKLELVDVCPVGGCHVCMGPNNGGVGCTDDSECAPGLACFNVVGSSKTNQVSGCTGSKNVAYGYCFTANYTWVPDPLYYLDTPMDSGAAFTNIMAVPDQCAIYAADPNENVPVPVTGESGKLQMCCAWKSVAAVSIHGLLSLDTNLCL